MAPTPRITAATAFAILAAVALTTARGADPPALTRAQIAEMLRAHNMLRRDVGVAPLAWDEQLAGGAQVRAGHLAVRGCRLSHQFLPENTGENLFWAGPVGGGGGQDEAEPVGPAVVVGAWAREREDYDARRNRCKGGECRHYTQLVWGKTREVGCGAARCRSGAEIWVCNYRPAGNIGAERPY